MKHMLGSVVDSCATSVHEKALVWMLDLRRRGSEPAKEGAELRSFKLKRARHFCSQIGLEQSVETLQA